MKKTLKALLSYMVITTSFFTMFISCSPSIIIFSDNYSYTPISKKSNLVICITDNSLTFDYIPAIKKELIGEKKGKHINTFFKEHLLEYIKYHTFFGEIRYDTMVSQPFTRKEIIELSEIDIIEFDIPVNNSVLKFSNSEADFILFLSDLSITTVSKINKVAAPNYYDPFTQEAVQFGSSTSYLLKDLLFQSKFLLWDNISKEPISHGFIQTVDRANDLISKDDWLNVIEDSVKKIFKQTPFTNF